MTTYSTDVDLYTGAVAGFRANGLAVAAALEAVGLIKTADTGQIDWATVALPGAGNSAGYEIRRFSDSLQATKPIYVKIEYSRATSGPGVILKYTFGTGSNGSGTITGVTKVLDHFSAGSGTVNSAGLYTRAIRASGKMTSAAAYATLHFGTILADGDIATGGFQFLGIQRTVDGDGTPNGDGFFIMTRDGGSTAASHQDFYDANRTLWRGDPHLFLSTASASYQDPFTTPQGGSAGIIGSEFSVIPCLSIGTWRMENPILDWVGVHKGVRLIGDEFTVTRFGASHTYKSTAALLRTADSVGAATNWALCVLWE